MLRSGSISTALVNNQLIIKSLQNITEMLQFRILDISGKEIFADTINFYEGVIKISINTLKQGMYILHLADKESYIMNTFEVNV